MICATEGVPTIGDGKAGALIEALDAVHLAEVLHILEISFAELSLLDKLWWVSAFSRFTRSLLAEDSNLPRPSDSPAASLRPNSTSPTGGQVGRSRAPARSNPP